MFSIRRDAEAPRYEKKTLFDFSKVTEEELFLMAIYSAKVKLQAIMRNLSPEAMANSSILATVDVKADLLELREDGRKSDHSCSALNHEGHRRD